jgi:hypothetical protein
VLDTALARTPAERYQTVAKFAGDVAAVTGRPAVGAVPATQEKTQLLDGTGGGVTQRISAKQPPPPAPPEPVKKRSLVPAAIAAVVVLGAGGAWVALKGGGKSSGTPAPPAAVDTNGATNVAKDTARNGGGRQSGGITTLASRDSTRRAANPPPPTAPSETRINPAQADALLEDLFEKFDAKRIGAISARDSAQHIFGTRGIATADSAFAAYILANAEAALDDQEPDRGHKAAALRWAQLATRLVPASRAYRQLAQDLSPN